MQHDQKSELPYRLKVQAYGDRANPQLVLLHGIATHTGIWQDTVRILQQSYHVVCIDLLGHGESPKPDDIDYTASLQADCIAHTLRDQDLDTKSIVIGFSIGALITAKLAASYPELVSSIVLIAPPVYTKKEQGVRQLIDSAYHYSYSLIARLPKTQTLKSLRLVQKNLPILIGKNMFNEHTWNPIMSSLRHTVQNQAIEVDLAVIQSDVPITVLYGSFDHLVIASRVRALSRIQPHIHLQKVRAPHGITRSYTQALTNLLQPAV